MSEDDYFLGWRFITPNSVWRHRATGWQFPASANRRVSRYLSPQSCISEPTLSPLPSLLSRSLHGPLSRQEDIANIIHKCCFFGQSDFETRCITLCQPRPTGLWAFFKTVPFAYAAWQAATRRRDGVAKPGHEMPGRSQMPPSQKYSISPNKRPKRRKR
jgi:hypothetical protein